MSVFHQKKKMGFCCLAILMLQACATSSALQVARDQFRHGSTTDALQTLSDADVSNRDQLLLYLDKGLVAQASGNYSDSMTAFERALELVEELDYVSIRDQTASIISSDWAARYGGEISEKLWIHTFQMLNFLLLNNPEGAAIEARRAVALFEEHGDILKNDIFTRTLMALSFESAGQLNGARVEYRKLEEDFDLPQPELLDRNTSELVFIVASGFIDPKLPGDLFISYDSRISFPYYAESFQQAPKAYVTVGEKQADFSRADTALVSISQRALNKRGKSIAARQALRLAAKHNIADSIEDQDELAGTLVKILLVAIEQADTRSWESLPAYLTLLRVPMEPGKHSVSLDVLVNDPSISSIDHQRVFDVDIAPGQRQYKLIRTGIASQQ
ncbi:MAG: hypothetical protein ACI9XK_002200 [Granulosicoccus sp.]|jgi:hypothetical protein